MLSIKSDLKYTIKIISHDLYGYMTDMYFSELLRIGTFFLKNRLIKTYIVSNHGKCYLYVESL